MSSIDWVVDTTNSNTNLCKATSNVGRACSTFHVQVRHYYKQIRQLFLHAARRATCSSAVVQQYIAIHFRVRGHGCNNTPASTLLSAPGHRPFVDDTHRTRGPWQQLFSPTKAVTSVAQFDRPNEPGGHVQLQLKHQPVDRAEIGFHCTQLT